jgi:hypothetical protein
METPQLSVRKDFDIEIDIALYYGGIIITSWVNVKSIYYQLYSDCIELDVSTTEDDFTITLPKKSGLKVKRY